MVLIKPRLHILANTKVRLEHLVTKEWEKQLLSSYKKWGLKLLRGFSGFSSPKHIALEFVKTGQKMFLHFSLQF